MDQSDPCSFAYQGHGGRDRLGGGMKAKAEPQRYHADCYLLLTTCTFPAHYLLLTALLSMPGGVAAVVPWQPGPAQQHEAEGAGARGAQDRPQAVAEPQVRWDNY